MHRAAHLRRPLIAAASAAVLAGAGLALAPAGSAAAPAHRAAPSGHRAAPAGHRAAPAGQHDVIANLFGWNWTSVASECTTVLGPAGYGAVQVSPPEESFDDSAAGHPWWDVYQPVSYRLDSRFGTEAQLRAMVSACHGAGVKVYADAVINHMTGQGSATGYAGTATTDKYTYPGLYQNGDFHHYPGDCSNSDDTIHQGDYTSNAYNVHNCELLGLSDLRTESDTVRATIAGYLNSLIADGVDGFRVDAAKHIPEADLAAIESRLNGAPYIYQEISYGAGEAVQPSDYYGSGDVLDFQTGVYLKQKFQGSISDLQTFGATWGGMNPSDKAVSFVANHDTERNGSTLSWKDGATDDLATLFLLGWDYGTPQVYSSFAWQNSDDAPPDNADGTVTATDCSSSAWYCMDRRTSVTGMVGFHNAVKGAAVTHWQAPSGDVIGFGRGSAGFMALNNSGSAATETFSTGLADGTYCNVVDDCATKATVSGGSATLTVPAKGAVAFDTAGPAATRR
ncbi:hypothetical protein BIV57_13960 [Mangrovactinospora gilvigrisea]|uniref:Alpha-amylase n=1 Tax=Mangrovactinospora gilvigrisea TaxID=1428644 RepID=A0A1J7BE61_9ACTN|nr:alpha-amylase family protein [Mangrovactinospora gilvigrisea]OIV36861.1 hypothetical protein BIV57_13960 [Mangrovactinospora gilvigrisea]